MPLENHIESDEVETELSDEIDTKERIKQLNQLIIEANCKHEDLQNQNIKLDKRIATFLQKEQENIATNDQKSQQKRDEKINSVDNEKRYHETLQSLHETKQQMITTQTQYDKLALELQTKLDEKEAKLTEIHDTFMGFKRDIAKSAESLRTGKPISKRLIAQNEEMESKKDQDVERVRLKNINLRTHLNKLEQQLHAKEQLAEGLHLIDFEQLKIENQTLNEKIEERNEELHKLRKKTTTTVQILTHIKEKLQFILAENYALKKESVELEEILSQNRDKLAKQKKERDNYRQTQRKIKNKEGFTKSALLLEDFNKREADLVDLQQHLTDLIRRHEYLVRRQARKTQQKVK